MSEKSSTSACSPVYADSIYFGGKIYTLDDSNTVAEAIAVRDDKIVFIGSMEAAKPFISDSTEQYDLKGKTVLPGLIESHSHPDISAYKYAGDAIEVEVNDSWETIVAKTKAYMAEHPDAKHIVNQGFSLLHCFTSGDSFDITYPTHELLDSDISDQIPVFFVESSLHSGFMNKKAMEYIGLNKDTPDPEPGVGFFFRDKNGEPTGAFTDCALTVFGMFPFMTDREFLEPALKRVIHDYNSYGYTGLCNEHISPSGCALPILADMRDSNTLNLNWQQSIFGLSSNTPEENLAVVKGFAEKYNGGNLIINTQKMIMDGGGDPKFFASVIPPASGKPFWTQESCDANVRCMLENGYHVHIHVMGDISQGIVLNSFEKYKDINPELTRSIVHNMSFPDANADQMIRIGGNLFCNVEPNWMGAGQLLPPGFDIYSNSYKISNAGIRLTFGSDTPAANMIKQINPFYQMYWAVKASKPASMPEGISRMTAIKSYSVNGSQAAGTFDRCGNLVVGKEADLIVIDRDFFTCDVDEIADIKVQRTVFQGRVVYEAE